MNGNAQDDHFMGRTQHNKEESCPLWPAKTTSCEVVTYRCNCSYIVVKEMCYDHISDWNYRTIECENRCYFVSIA